MEREYRMREVSRPVANVCNIPYHQLSLFTSVVEYSMHYLPEFDCDIPNVDLLSLLFSEPVPQGVDLKHS